MPGWDDDDPYADVRGEPATPLDDASQRVLDAIARIDATWADIVESQNEDDEADDDPDEDMQQRMAALCSSDTAPLEWRSIFDRVQRGTQTWKRVYDEPRQEEGPAGVALVREALTASTRDTLAAFAERAEAAEQRVDEVNRQRMRRD